MKASEAEEKGSEEKAEEQALEGPTEALSPADLNAAWKRFVERNADGPASRYATLSASLPELDGEQIRFSVVNIIQQKDMDEVKAELMDFLRTELRNVRLQLEIVLKEKKSVKKEFLSEREKYERMVQQNPLLEELRKRLDLDLNN